MTFTYRILHVDDNKDSCELLSFILVNSGMNCEVISSDCAKVAIFLIANRSFDLYILDYVLPDVSGIDLCRLIRENDSETPILFFTAMARHADYVEGMNAGANEYLVKPNDLEKLPQVVEHLLNENASSNIASFPKNLK
jgi:DNA-binding response OmpR family regulator